MKRILLVTCLVLLPLPLAALQLFTFDGLTPEVDADGSEFVFARLVYGSGMQNFFGFRGGGSWRTDWPKADKQFIFGIDRMSNIRVVMDTDVAVEILDPKLYSYPFVYAVEVGRMELTQPEADRLREYMLRGGFLVVDDFHGLYEWQYFTESIQRVLPGRAIVDIPESDPLLHILYDLDQRTQIPGRRHLYRASSGEIVAELPGGPPRWRGIYDDAGRLMVAINFNMDMGDAWEHADDPVYPEPMTALAYRFGINYIIYAMTH